MALKWGIASCGLISQDFVTALKSLPKDHHQVVAVAARSQSSAEKFAKEHSILRAYEGYTTLAQDKDVDIVYIGAINTKHLEVSKLMLENGKHVLCEKPLGINQKQVEELINCARKYKVFFMEAIWSRTFPVYAELRKLIDLDSIGEVFYVSANFGTPLQGVDRVSKKELGGGTILDIGIYTLQLQQFVYKGLEPIKVVAAGHLNKDGTDESANVIITYPGGKTAVLSCNGRVTLSNEAQIFGTKGIMRIPTFWCPTTIITDPAISFTSDLPVTSAKFNFKNSIGLVYEAEHVRDCIQKGLLESPLVPHCDSLELSKLMDSIRKDIGVEYDEDI